MRSSYLGRTQCFSFEAADAALVLDHMEGIGGRRPLRLRAVGKTEDDVWRRRERVHGKVRWAGPVVVLSDEV